jgi:ribosomal-protein-alanine acetyltransferase
MKSTARPARAADLDAVAAIAAARPTAAGWSRAQFSEEIGRDGSDFLVVESAGAVAGYAVVRDAPDEAQLVDIAVSPEHSRKGLGRLLLKEVAARAKARKLLRVTLEVSALNSPALALYRGAGFAVVGRRPKFYNDGSDAVLMDADLA